jgi:hypothetical protein
MPLGGSLRAHTEDGSQVLPDVVVDADGNYSFAVKPAGITSRLTCPPSFSATPPRTSETTPPDSDVIPLPPGEFDALADGEVFDVTGGSETVIDIGVVELGGS